MSSFTYRTPVEKFPDFQMHYLEVPAKGIERLGGKFRLRLLCRLNGAPAYQCGLMALGGGKGCISLSRQRMRELGLALGDKVKVELRPDTSKYGMKMPPEFRELLRQDPDGKARFEALLPGKQRTLLFRVGSAKNSDTRLERAIAVLENLKRLPTGKESIPELLGKRSRPGAGRW